MKIMPNIAWKNQTFHGHGLTRRLMQSILLSGGCFSNIHPICYRLDNHENGCGVSRDIIDKVVKRKPLKFKF